MAGLEPDNSPSIHARTGSKYEWFFAQFQINWCKICYFKEEMPNKKLGGQKKLSLPPWLPVAASVALMVMVALIAVTNARTLKNATQWRRHSTEVILAAQSFGNNLLDIQREERGYVTAGDTNALASFYKNVALEPELFDRLVTLTADNLAQQERLKNLVGAVGAVLSYDKRSIAIYRQQGFAGISRLDATGEGRAVLGRAQDTVGQFLADEQRLWDIRDISEETQYQYAEQLLVIGSLLAAGLLLIATWLASRELRFRQEAEIKLRETLLLQNAILGSANYAIVSSDPRGIIQTLNPAAERLLGYSPAEVIGQATPMLWRDPLEIADRAASLSRKLGVPVRPTFEAIAKKVEADSIDEGEWTFIRKDGSRFPGLLVVTSLKNEAGETAGYLGVFNDISERKKGELEREQLIAELKRTLAEVKTLSGLIPICAWCKNVRADTGYWQTVEQYVRTHSGASFSHGVCPSCAAKFKDEIERKHPGALTEKV
jgi:PAS domain S-box-containing protein